MDRKLYLDLDDCLVDFTGAIPTEFRISNGRLPKHLDDAMWAYIDANPAFFASLLPCPGALAFFARVRHLNPSILTACSQSNYVHVATQKRAWVREHLGRDVVVLPVSGGKHKWLFMHAPGDILIDDYSRNIDAWIAAGGIGILHQGDFAATAKRLAMVLLAPTAADLAAMGDLVLAP